MTLYRPLALLLALLAPLASAAPPQTASALVAQAEAAIAAGDDRRAEALISTLASGALDPVQLARVQIVRAEIGLARNQPEVVLRALPPTSDHVPGVSARIEQLRARALLLGGDVVGAVRVLVARERRLSAPTEIADNREQIWSGLIATPLRPGALDRIASEDPMTRGWLDLAGVLQQGPSASAVAAWAQRNPGHPGESKLALIRPGSEMPSSAAPDGAAPARPIALGGGYALLLPMSGPLASAGRALRDGFVAAWFDLPEPRRALRVYDTGSDGAFAATAYRDALRDGAGTLVGPLTRDAIAAVAAQAPTLPWLTLNHAEGLAIPALQMSLAPEDEGRAAAADAIAAGRLHALLLAPSNGWGDRALAAFTRRFVEQGGEVLQVTRFTDGTQDFGKPLRELLKLDVSAQRHAALDRALAQNTEFEPRPREDADLLFAALRTAEARALVPQLDFFRARDLTTYTGSAAYDGQVDRQLDGLRLCDMPWVIESAGAVADQRERLRELFPEALHSQPRLFALGMDALRLAASASSLRVAATIDGATGQLTLAPDRRVTRTLACRLIVDGRPASGP